MSSPALNNISNCEIDKIRTEDDPDDVDRQTTSSKSDPKTESESATAIDEVQTAMGNLFPGNETPVNSSLSSSLGVTTDDSKINKRKQPRHSISYSYPTTVSAFEPNLIALLQSYDWLGALSRLQTHPFEAALVGAEGRVPLHIACDLDAPALVVKAIMQAYPNAVTLVGTSSMTPLHITCSSAHASVEVVQVLLTSELQQYNHSSWGYAHVEKKQDSSPTTKGIGSSTYANRYATNNIACSEKNLLATSMKDIDGDTPLHAACRCGAPYTVLEILLSANPWVVYERDREGFTPLLRLWVRYYVSLGEDTIKAISELQGQIFQTVFYGTELWGAWEKTLLLLRVAYFTILHEQDRSFTSSSSSREQLGTTLTAEQNLVFRPVHAAATFDCPRLVLKLATLLYPHQLHETDRLGYTPLMIAAFAPVFKVHNLGGDGYDMDDDDDPIYDTDPNEGSDEGRSNDTDTEPSVIDILLSASSPEAAAIPHVHTQRLPLIMAILSGKRWYEGLKSLFNAYPDANIIADPVTGLYPFMLAATIGASQEIIDERFHPNYFSFLHESQKRNKADVSTIFELLRRNPQAIRWGNCICTKCKNE